MDDRASDKLFFCDESLEEDMLWWLLFVFEEALEFDR